MGSVGDVPYNQDDNNKISYEVIYEMLETAGDVASDKLPFVGMSLAQSLIWVGLHSMSDENPTVTQV